MSSNSESLLSLFNERKAQVSIVGCGYVGLPLCVAIAKAGYFVNAIDLDPKKVDSINLGITYIEGVSSEDLTMLGKAGKLKATLSPEVIFQSHVVIVCVPTPLDKNEDPDLSFILNAMTGVAHFAHSGLLIVLESTTYPGTTREVVLPLFEKQGLCIGSDFFLCFSPERIDPGREDYTVFNTPKVIGGITQECLQMGQAFYASILHKIVPVSSVETAEMVKILENSFRSVNIAFINEMMKICERLGFDIWEIIEAAETKPFGFMKFSPGPGVGGHCIPIDPLYLSWRAGQFGETCAFISLAHKMNKSMPKFWLDQIERGLSQIGQTLSDSCVLVLGISYKRDIKDLRESPALDIIDLLRESGAQIIYYDPYFTSFVYHEQFYLGEEDVHRALQAADCAILVTDHTIFKEIEFDLYECIFINTRGHGKPNKGGKEQHKLQQDVAYAVSSGK